MNQLLSRCFRSHSIDCATLFARGGFISLRTVLGKFGCTAATLASGIPLGREGLLTTGQTKVVSIQPENPPQAPRLPVVLCVCLSDLPAILRQNLLSSRQYEVLRAASLSEVEMVCKNRHINLTIFGAAVGPWFKTAVFELLRQHNRNPEIFEIGQAQAFLPSARTVGDSPEALMKAVNAFILHVARTTPQVNRR